ncbi:uncharacterized protein LOC124256943 [Haliotis rubra]|uniref:uncharacterized protein LOC124256943 n=1 Tax=Haliotis rubra TaxID=36100 RepID=UPI001EE5B0C9|nr:uncharacterized protein LOC124256943 [Haliotis rubra]
MSSHATWITFLISCLALGVSASETGQFDVKTCSNYVGHDDDSEEDSCAQADVVPDLVCTTGTVIVLKALLLVVKKNSECTKRIASERVCCKRNNGDVLYDGDCLQSVWNDEDGEHYRTFMKDAIRECMERQECTLSHSMFQALQRRLYNNTHASSFRIVYQCVDDPTDTGLLQPVYISRSENEVNIKGTTNSTRKCVVRSPAGGMISVKALDVRSSASSKDSHTELKLKTEASEKIIRANDLPLFGFMEIISGRRINITVTGGMNVWLRIKAADGENVNITCGEPDRETTKIATTPTGAILGEQGYGFWPLVFTACGAVIMLSIVIVVCGIWWICKYRKRRKRRFRSTSSFRTTQEYLDAYDPPYATVQDQRPSGKAIRVTRSMSSQTIQRSFSPPSGHKLYPRSTSMRSLRDRPPMAPPPPPRMSPAMSYSQGKTYNQCYSRLSRTPTVPRSNLEQLEAFLEWPEPEVTSPSRMGSVKESTEGSGYASPSLLNSLFRVESQGSVKSQRGSPQAYGSMPRSDNSSGPCLGSVFESEGSVTESLLVRGDTALPPAMPTQDLLGYAEASLSLLSEHKGDENHNEFESNTPDVLT